MCLWVWVNVGGVGVVCGCVCAGGWGKGGKGGIDPWELKCTDGLDLVLCVTWVSTGRVCGTTLGRPR